MGLSVGRQAISKKSAERLYRAVDREGKTLDLMLSEHRDTAAARRFFKHAVGKTASLIVSPSIKVAPI